MLRFPRTALLLGLAAAAFTALQIADSIHAEPLQLQQGAAANCRKDVTPPAVNRPEASDAIKVMAPPQGAYSGLFSIGTTATDIGQFTQKTGRGPAIVYSFHDWISDEDFASTTPRLRTLADPMEDKSVTPLALAEMLRKEGRVLALSWAIQCCDFSSIDWWYGRRKTQVNVTRVLRGELDAYIRQVAGQVRSFGGPIMLSIFSEFNLQGAYSFGNNGDEPITEVDDICVRYGDPGWPDGPERVRDAFRRVIDIFRQERVTNVTWFMYAASRYMDPTHDDHSEWLHPKYFYPGDGYIDWVGQSAYYVDPSWKVSINEDAAVIERALRPGYDAWAEVTQRPMFIPELGAAGTMQTDRSAVIRSVMGSYLPALPRIKAFASADFLIGELCCQVPRVGIAFAAETTAWRQSVGDNAHYVHQVVTSGKQASPAPAPTAPATAPASPRRPVPSNRWWRR